MGVSLRLRRFDNVVYRIGLAGSRKEARQLVKHYHFLVNGKRSNVPSMILNKGDSIELVDKSRKSVKFANTFEINGMREVPAWLDVEKSKFKGILRDLPKREDVTSTIEERLVVELYSK